MLRFIFTISTLYSVRLFQSYEQLLLKQKIKGWFSVLQHLKFLILLNIICWKFVGSRNCAGCWWYGQARNGTRTKNRNRTIEASRIPYASSSRLESTGGLNPPSDPIIQQKRRHVTSSLEEVSCCAGLEGTPGLKDKEEEQRVDREEQVEDYREYYNHHKASPLSEIKLVDTRKPITRATDGTADADEHEGLASDVIGWRPEQLDTAEEELRRAAEIFRRKENINK